MKFSEITDQEENSKKTVKVFAVQLGPEGIEKDINISTNIYSKDSIDDCDISIHIDDNNNFNKIFIPFAKELYTKINNLGLKCKIAWGDRKTNGRKIILGAHSYPKYWIKNTTDDDIIVNFEPIHKGSWRNINPDYLKLLSRKCVFDYCEINLPYLEESYCFNTPPFFSDLIPKKEKKVDVLFIGSINKYRIDTLKRLKEEDINIDAKYNILGNKLYRSIDEARIYLNLDLDKDSTFNEYRFMSCAQTNTLFAGHCGNIKYHPQAERLIGLSIFKNDREMIEGLKNLICDNSHMQKAFTEQYKYAKANREKFESFLRHHFLK